MLSPTDDLLTTLRRPYVTRAEAFAAGFGRRRLQRLIASGELVRIHPGVYAIAAAELGPVDRIGAAVASLRDPVLASHRSAALLWEIAPADPDVVDVILPRRSLPEPRCGVVVHRPRDRGDLNVSTRSGIPCTNPLRTLIDLGAVAPEWVEPAFEQLTIRRIVTPSAARALLDRRSRHGRDGAGALRAVLDDWPLGDSCPDSALEVACARILRTHGHGDFVHHALIEGFEVDFAFHRERVIVEGDGFEHHGTRAAFEADRQRDAILSAAGWVVVRVTWWQLRDEPREFAERLRRTREARRWV